uniref:Uncharacterized protein n=1 Tax=Corethron hystrix TaxID=216773 RepID=A0A7S1BJM6_9STRA|mmetsp:Transcript_31057/g.71083  ORF Transcript_31057/g.71083 Transcript_31057/m.71083 type:complete len:258 (+) Transcript_31057:179-952(+)
MSSSLCCNVEKAQLLRTVHRQYFTAYFVVALYAISFVAGKKEEAIVSHKVIQESLRGSRRQGATVISRDIQSLISPSSASKTDSKRLHVSLLSTKDRAMKDAELVSGSCYKIKSSFTKQYLYINSNGFLASIDSQPEHPQIFCIKRVSDNQFELTAENVDGSRRLLKLPGTRSNGTDSVDFRFFRQNDGTYILKYGKKKQLMDNGYNKVRVAKPLKCFDCAKFKFEFKIESSADSFLPADERFHIDVLTETRYPASP